jgi:hypothetical protein
MRVEQNSNFNYVCASERKKKVDFTISLLNLQLAD